jgi:hypothetical protein
MKTLQKEDFSNAVRPGLLENYQSLEALEEFRQLGVELSYVYCLENGEEFACIALSPGDLSK